MYGRRRARRKLRKVDLGKVEIAQGNSIYDIRAEKCQEMRSGSKTPKLWWTSYVEDHKTTCVWGRKSKILCARRTEPY